MPPRCCPDLARDIPIVRGLRVLVILSALMALTSVSLDMYLPALGIALNAGPGAIQMTLSGFFFGFTVGQLLWGSLSDRFGRRGPVALGVLLFVLGSGGCALSGTAMQMVGWRVVQAVGACAGPVLARAMVRDLYGRDRSAQMLSTLMLVMGVMPLLGPLLGGQILAVWSWQGIFWVLVGFGLLIFLGTLTLPETLPQSRRNLQRLRETFFSYPLLLRNRRLVGYAVAGGFFYGGLHAQVAGTPFAYIDFYHVSPQAYGLLFGLNIVGLGVHARSNKE
jgi:MFS transporter, DHA1 family, multidrug resistance protein